MNLHERAAEQIGKSKASISPAGPRKEQVQSRPSSLPEQTAGVRGHLKSAFPGCTSDALGCDSGAPEVDNGGMADDEATEDEGGGAGMDYNGSASDGD